MRGSDKETVIVVHGTWAAPVAGATRWYAPAQSAVAAGDFVTKLDLALAERGSPARCWAHYSVGSQIFCWSGENDWVERTNAAAALKEYVHQLQSEGWRCHIVAHSHGGNVVVEAFANPSATRGPAGKIVTLGTPFMNTTTPIERSRERRKTLIGIASWTAMTILFLLFTAAVYLAISGFPGGFIKYLTYDFPNLALFLAYLFTLAGLIWFIFRRIARRGAPLLNEGKSEPPQTNFLALGSLRDEAWQTLHHLRTIESPLRIRTNLLSYVASVLRANVSSSIKVARIQGARSYRDLGFGSKLLLLILHVFTAFTAATGAWLAIWFALLRDDIAILGTTGLGAAITLAGDAVLFLLGLIISSALLAFLTNRLGPDFYSAYLSPFRWCVHRVGSLGSIFTALATYVLRRKAWLLLQTIAMGLEGYQYELPAIEQHPNNIPVKYENIPADAEGRALMLRSNWAALHLSDVSEVFAKIVVTAADINSLLKTIAADQSLIHNAYYIDEVCISRIADWIANKG